MTQKGADERDPQTYAIIGAAMEVHRRLGPGFVEPVYQEAFAVELAAQNIPFQREVRFKVVYRDRLLDCSYKADFVCFGEVLVETKALEKLPKVEHAQVINYLKVSGLKGGLLLNFGTERLEYKRFVYTISIPEATP